MKNYGKQKRRNESSKLGPFIKAFQDKYYPRTFREAKRNKFFKLVPSLMSGTEYEKKYIEFFEYATNIIADELDHCKRFEEGLRGEIYTLMIANAEWTKFSKLVEKTMRVEKSLAEKKQERESYRGGHTIHPSSASQDQSDRGISMRFVLGVFSKGNLKP